MFGYDCSRRVGTLIPYLATEFLSFNIERNSINERLYFVSDTKLILIVEWPCHVPNDFNQQEREEISW